MTTEFLKYFFTSAILHPLLNIITDFVDVKSITPENINIFWLSSEMWLIWDDYAHEPIRINKTHQSSCTWSVLLQISKHLKQFFIFHGNSKRLPNCFKWFHVKRFRISKLTRKLVSYFLPDFEANCIFSAEELSWFSP